MYAHQLINFARTKTNNIQVAEDIVQDIFVYLYTHRSIETNIKTYLFQTLKRKIYNYWRHEIIRTNYQAHIEYKGTSVADDVSTVLEAKELYNQFEEHISTLPPQCQKVFRLRREHHLSNKDIADKLGITVKAVEAQITMAIKKLRPHFDQVSSIAVLLTIYQTFN